MEPTENPKNDPIEDYTVKIFVEKVRGQYRACFKIGVQTFFVCEREDKSEADWYAGCLQTAFDHYALFLGFAAGKLMKEKDEQITALATKCQERLQQISRLQDEIEKENELKNRLDLSRPIKGKKNES